MKKVIGRETNIIYKIQTSITDQLYDDYIPLENEDYILKLLSKKDNKFQNIDNMFSYLKNRKIQDLNIAKPIEKIIEDDFGYIIKIKPNMVSLHALLKSDFDIDWWKDSGGLRKRLHILCNLSQLLSELHNRGLVYGSLSPNSILISNEDKSTEVFLLNVENITHKSKIGNINLELQYSAPELIKGISGIDTYTDDYSFTQFSHINSTKSTNLS